MVTFDFITYFRNVASSLKDILHTTDDKHFHRVSSLSEMEEFLAASRSNSEFQLVVLDKISGRLDDGSQSDNLLDRRFHTFYIFKNAEHGNFDEAEQVKKDCETIARKIMSKMFKDKRESANGLLNLNRSSFYYDTVGPIAQGYFGVMCNFSLLDAAGIIYNAADWT